MGETAMAATGRSWSKIARRIRVPLGFLFAVVYLWRARPNWQSLALGGIVVALGVFLRAVASGHVKKNEELTTSGPYAYCRNPLYLGSMILALGFVIASHDIWMAVAIAALFGLIYVPVIRSEEDLLSRHFAEYDDYARRVPRLLPTTIWLSGLTSGFSPELYRQHREYNAVIGAAAILAALVVKILWFPHSW
jgi:protein-S-isoprenylcysteine O-methyltransferase Ste14